jgi:hypothetical protein
VTLVGWSQAAERHDGGVPAEVAGVVARALTTVARVTFLSSAVHAAATNVWSPLDGDLVRVPAPKGVAGSIAATLRGAPSGIQLVSTKRPETAVRLFDDAGFPWWLQGQVVVLSKPEAPPPEIDEETLLALTGEEWTSIAARLALAGVDGVLRPGVDGDVAGLLSLTDAFEQVVLAALESETRRAGFDWAIRKEGALVR